MDRSVATGISAPGRLDPRENLPARTKLPPGNNIMHQNVHARPYKVWRPGRGFNQKAPNFRQLGHSHPVE
jgi:hypothetical protein